MQWARNENIVHDSSEARSRCSGLQSVVAPARELLGRRDGELGQVTGRQGRPAAASPDQLRLVREDLDGSAIAPLLFRSPT